MHSPGRGSLLPCCLLKRYPSSLALKNVRRDSSSVEAANAADVTVENYSAVPLVDAHDSSCLRANSFPRLSRDGRWCHRGWEWLSNLEWTYRRRVPLQEMQQGKASHTL